MGNSIVFTKALVAASVNNIAQTQSATSGTALTLNGSAVAGGVATLDSQRRVLFTSTSAVETASFVLTGTSQGGQVISETVTFSGASTTAVSNLDYLTVTKILPTANSVGTIQVGTNTTGSSPWLTWNFNGYSPINLGMAVELVSGAVNFTVQYTYDDPNNLPTGVAFPLPFSSVINAAAATTDGTISTPIIATRVLINSGTGTIRARFLQAGVG